MYIVSIDSQSDGTHHSHLLANADAVWNFMEAYCEEADSLIRASTTDEEEAEDDFLLVFLQDHMNSFNFKEGGNTSYLLPMGILCHIQYVANDCYISIGDMPKETPVAPPPPPKKYHVIIDTHHAARISRAFLSADGTFQFIMDWATEQDSKHRSVAWNGTGFIKKPSIEEILDDALPTIEDIEGSVFIELPGLCFLHIRVL